MYNLEKNQAKLSPLQVSLAFIFIGPYLLGWLFPNMWWGTHYVAFISKPFQWATAFGSLLILLEMKFGWCSRKISQLQLKLSKIKLFLPYTLALVAIFFYWKVPLIHSIYGDAYRFSEVINDVVLSVPDQAMEDIFSLRFAPWDGELTVLGVLAHLSYFLEVSWGQLFGAMSILFGGLFAFVFVRLVVSKVTSTGWQAVLILGGLISPYTLIFHQHFEIYAPIYFFQLLWFIQLVTFTEQPTKKSMVLLVILTIINMKLHTITLLMFPALLLGTLHVYFPHFKWVATNLSWKGVAMCVFIPVAVIGMIAYFFIFQDHLDDRNLATTAFEYDHLFLPLMSPEPPLDKYNILSFNHFFDYFNLLFHGVPIILLVIVYLAFLKRNYFRNNQNILLVSTTLLLYFGLFFVVNPLLTMPRDWDLLSMTVPGLLVLAVVMCQRIETSTSPQFIITLSSLIALLSSSAFVVNAAPKEMVKRLDALIEWNHATYYEWTTILSRYRMDIEPLTPTGQLIARDKLLNKLKPTSIPGVDREYAGILRDQGFEIFRGLKDPSTALPYLEKAFYYYPDLMPNVQLLVEAHFALGTYKDAYKYVHNLIDHEFPTNSRALSMAIHCALEAQLYKEAEVHCIQYLKLEPDNKTIQTIINRIRNNEDIDKLKHLFRKPVSVDSTLIN